MAAALALTPLAAPPPGRAHLPASARSHSPAPDATPVVALSVPNVIGLPESRASDALRAQGFSMEFRTEAGEPATGRTDDVVIQQSPGAGARVAGGTRIALTVAPAGSTVSTPPANAGGSAGAGTVSAPAGSVSAPATGVAGSTGGGAGAGATGGGASAAGGGGAPVRPAPVPAPAPQPPAVAPPAVPGTPPAVVQVPPPPPLPLPKLPASPLGVVGGLLRGIV
ncbi:PASTA domain-containing protein [Leifsonia sp. EB34]|uniref:PASTA domain-containing protein n=1 Tax=Leifsonia sp. EB34 TaxID=3156303 RepID=UPI003511D1AF